MNEPDVRQLYLTKLRDVLQPFDPMTIEDVVSQVAAIPYLRALIDGHHRQSEQIAADRKLTPEGKADGISNATATAQKAISEWHDTRLTALDGDLLEQRAALMGIVDAPDPQRVALMSEHLRKHTPEDIAVFYNSATDSERRAMEAASVAIGRMPMTTANGKEWKTLLDPELVGEAILSRAEQTNPAAAQQVRELVEIRAMQVTLTGVALSEL